MAAFDQALVRRVGKVWRRLGGQPLCEVCASHSFCELRQALMSIGASRSAKVTVSECGSYIPVISFQDMTGIEGVFNTFRRGAGWGRRVQVGDRVAIYDLTSNGLCGIAKVSGVYVGPLADMLSRHAAGNHLMKGKPSGEVEPLLAMIIRRLYGKNYGALDQEFSVIEFVMEHRK